MTRGKKRPAEYDVGFCKPPAHGQFSKGKSGNPKGRPKNAHGKHKLQDAILQRAREIFLEEGDRQITVREGDLVMKMDAYRLAVRAAHMSAAKGSGMAQRTVIQNRLRIEAEVASTMHEVFHTAVMYKETCAAERRRCRAAGLPEPKFHFDPHEIEADWQTLTIQFKGPLTSDHKTELEERLRLRAGWEEDFLFCRERLSEHESESARLIAMQSQRIFDVINQSLPARYQKPLSHRLSDPSTDPEFPQSD